jgi:hypothetical protein
MKDFSDGTSFDSTLSQDNLELTSLDDDEFKRWRECVISK